MRKQKLKHLLIFYGKEYLLHWNYPVMSNLQLVCTSSRIRHVLRLMTILTSRFYLNQGIYFNSMYLKPCTSTHWSQHFVAKRNSCTFVDSFLIVLLINDLFSLGSHVSHGLLFFFLFYIFAFFIAYFNSSLLLIMII